MFDGRPMTFVGRPTAANDFSSHQFRSTVNSGDAAAHLENYNNYMAVRKILLLKSYSKMTRNIGGKKLIPKKNAKL